MSTVTPKEAQGFICDRTAGFRKDIAICLQGIKRQYHDNGALTHAYFPALMTCLSYWEFLAGVKAGNIKASGAPAIKQVKKFRCDYMDATLYHDRMIDILWEGFRNKMAHLAHPYFIFDTQDKVSGPRQRISWRVSEKVDDPHLWLEPKSYTLQSAPAAYNATYDHLLHISLPQLKEHLMAAATAFAADLGSGKEPIDQFDRALRTMYALP